jgi:SAM-dependent methyltransferase
MSLPDAWAVAAAYERYMGRWSRGVAVEFVTWLGVPPGASWLDVGCGTGALSDIILDTAAPGRLIGVDPSYAFVREARGRHGDPRVRFTVGDAQDAPLLPERFDSVVSGLVLNFLPDQQKALDGMQRVVRPGGVVAAYVWDYAGRMDLIRYFWDAAAALDPGAVDLDEGRRFPVCRPERLERLFAGAGLTVVESRSIDVPTRFRDFDDYWLPFLGGQGPAPGYALSLDGGQRSRLAGRLRAALPVDAGGSISLVARAWAVRGRRAR